MLYMIVGIDCQDSAPKRLKARESHLVRLRQLETESRLIMAGPNPASDAQDSGVTGSLIVAEFESLSAAKAWADADPYIEAGVYESVIIKPFKKVLPS